MMAGTLRMPVEKEEALDWNCPSYHEVESELSPSP